MNHEVKNRTLSIQTQKKNTCQFTKKKYLPVHKKKYKFTKKKYLPVHAFLLLPPPAEYNSEACGHGQSHFLPSFVLLFVLLIDKAGHKCEV